MYYNSRDSLLYLVLYYSSSDHSSVLQHAAVKSHTARVLTTIDL